MPTYTGGQVQPGYNIGGQRDPGAAVASAGQATAASGAELGHSIQNLAQTYNDVLVTRFTRDEDVRAHTFFRERRLSSSMLKEEQADSLYFKEKEAMGQAREDFLKDSPLGTRVAGDIFDKHAASYLDWSGQHMLKEASAAERKSKKKAANSVVKEAGIAPMSTGSLEQLYGMADVLYPLDKELAASLKESIDQSFDQSNAARDPEGALKWMTKNEVKLVALIGQGRYDKRLNTMRAATQAIENQMNTRQTRARQEEERRVIAGERSGMNMVLDNIANGKSMDDTEFSQFAVENNLDHTSAQKVRKFYYDTIGETAKINSDRAAVAIFNQKEDITEEQINMIAAAAQRGDITAATYKELEKRRVSQQKDAESGLTIPRKRVDDLFTNTAGGGMMGTSPQTTQMKLYAQDQFDKLTQGLSPIEKAKAMDISDPSSPARQVNNWIAEQVIEGPLMFGNPTWAPNDRQLQKLQNIKAKTDPEGNNLDAFFDEWDKK